MDSIYLKRFNSSTDLKDLQDECALLLARRDQLRQHFVSYSNILNYSEAQRIANKLATVKAKLSYIDRMVHIVKKRTEEQRIQWHPNGYYGDLL